jgi:Trk K+ transport system NAD-binding subunit
VEEKIPLQARVVGVAIRDLDLPQECAIAAVIRQGKMVIPRGPLVLEAGDEVLAVTDRAGAERLAALFAPPEPVARIAVPPQPSPPPKRSGRRPKDR